jgi:hypothetical protein
VNQIKRKNSKLKWQHISATRISASAFGVFCGLTGMIVGYFETLQGNIAPNGFIISTIGPTYSMWDTYGIWDLWDTYSAITVIPNFFLTGIMAILVSFLVIIWSVGFIHKKYGGMIFLLLSVIQFLVGGSFVLDLALITGIVATRINQPLTWWRSHLSVNVQNVLAQLWPWSFIAYLFLVIVLLGITIFGVNNASLLNLLGVFAAAMFVPLLLMIFGGFACDIRRETNLNKDTLTSASTKERHHICVER